MSHYVCKLQYVLFRRIDSIGVRTFTYYHLNIHKDYIYSKLEYVHLHYPYISAFLSLHTHIALKQKLEQLTPPEFSMPIPIPPKKKTYKKSSNRCNCKPTHPSIAFRASNQGGYLGYLCFSGKISALPKVKPMSADPEHNICGTSVASQKIHPFWGPRIWGWGETYQKPNGGVYRLIAGGGYIDFVGRWDLVKSWFVFQKMMANFQEFCLEVSIKIEVKHFEVSHLKWRNVCPVPEITMICVPPNLTTKHTKHGMTNFGYLSLWDLKRWHNPPKWIYIDI